MLNPTELQILVAELTNDPLARGYSTMTDLEATYSLREVFDRQRIRRFMESSEVFQAIDMAEFNALADRRQGNIMTLLSFGRLNPQGKEATMFINYFGAGSATVTALQTLRLENINRARELGIPNTFERDITAARLMM